ncbi:MAG: hypothetical protein DWQ53_09780 [Microcystis flos-aquae DF17]|nr:MAG: hypothetical protein DWQ53_09780 [Microcystis flos-aquae DF17]
METSIKYRESKRGFSSRNSSALEDGWALEAAISLDAARPGFLRHVLSAPALTRQVGFLVIAERLRRSDVEDRFSALTDELSGRIISEPPQVVLSAEIGPVPDGLIGVLRRLGTTPLRHIHAYAALLEMLRSKEVIDARRRQCLLQVSRLTHDRWEAILELPPCALRPTIVESVGNGHAARRLSQAVAAIRVICSGASEEALRQSLLMRSDRLSVTEFARSWLRRADRPPVVYRPLDEAPDFQRVTPSTASGVARQFRNCLGSKLERLASGVWGAWVWQTEALIATVQLFDHGPVCAGVFARSNLPVPPSAEHLLKKRLGELGVMVLQRKEPEAWLWPISGRERFDAFFD